MHFILKVDVLPVKTAQLLLNLLHGPGNSISIFPIRERQLPSAASQCVRAGPPAGLCSPSLVERTSFGSDGL